MLRPAPAVFTPVKVVPAPTPAPSSEATKPLPLVVLIDAVVSLRVTVEPKAAVPPFNTALVSSVIVRLPLVKVANFAVVSFKVCVENTVAVPPVVIVLFAVVFTLMPRSPVSVPLSNDIDPVFNPAGPHHRSRRPCRGGPLSVLGCDTLSRGATPVRPAMTREKNRRHRLADNRVT